MEYKLIYGEAIEEMQKLIAAGIKVDAIITDPPYGTTPLKWDSIISFNSLWNTIPYIRSNNCPTLLFGHEPFSSYMRTSNIKEYKYDWYWQKERLTNVFQVKRRPGKVIETISVFYNMQPTYHPQKTVHKGKKVTNKVGVDARFSDTMSTSQVKPLNYIDDGTRHPNQIIKFSRDKLKIHPTQKPVALMEYLVKTYTNEGDTVLDFTCGSGSTGVACKNLNRDFIGIDNGICDTEKSEFYNWKWVDVAKYRIENEGGKNAS